MITVREHLLRRARQAWIYRGVAFALLVGLMFWMKSSELERYIALPVLFILVVVFMPLGAYFARCPNCRFPMEFMGRLRLRHGAKKYRTNFCPHCGLNFDAEHDEPALESAKAIPLKTNVTGTGEANQVGGKRARRNEA